RARAFAVARGRCQAQRDRGEARTRRERRARVAARRYPATAVRRRGVSSGADRGGAEREGARDEPVHRARRAVLEAARRRRNSRRAIVVDRARRRRVRGGIAGGGGEIAQTAAGARALRPWPRSSVARGRETAAIAARDARPRD